MIITKYLIKICTRIIAFSILITRGRLTGELENDLRSSDRDDDNLPNHLLKEYSRISMCSLLIGQMLMTPCVRIG